MCFVQLIMLTLFLTISIHSAPTDIAPSCMEAEFKCAKGKCIRNVLVCNMRQDCDDGSDEDTEMCKKYRNTTEGTTASSKTGIVGISSTRCNGIEFKCASGQCIFNETTCDGYNDCEDGSDEVVNWCKTRLCQEEEFKCSSGQCIHGDSLCDGYFDCADASDENEALCKVEDS